MSVQSALQRWEGGPAGRSRRQVPVLVSPAGPASTVVLFVSDVHFGRGPSDDERRKEEDLLACLRAHADRVEHLYLVGDLFDGYIEYRHLVPKGAFRLRALLSDWTDRGIPVTYLLGNHDPWHRDHFPQELGVRLVPEAVDVEHFSVRLHLTHGDAQASSHGLYPWLRPVVRHPLAACLYRAVLPADLGLGLARRVSRWMHDEAPDPHVVSALRAYARRQLRRPDIDAVVMGHSHVPVVRDWSEGTYLNTGNWYEHRTFGRLDDDGLHLLRWNGTRAVDIEPDHL